MAPGAGGLAACDWAVHPCVPSCHRVRTHLLPSRLSMLLAQLRVPSFRTPAYAQALRVLVRCHLFYAQGCVLSLTLALTLTTAALLCMGVRARRAGRAVRTPRPWLPHRRRDRRHRWHLHGRGPFTLAARRSDVTSQRRVPARQTPRRPSRADLVLRLASAAAQCIWRLR